MSVLAANNVNEQTLESIQQRESLGEVAFTVGNTPVDIQINLATNKIYVANHGSNSVTVIDSNSGTSKSVQVGAEPSSIAIDEIRNKIYVANKLSNTVSVIDGLSDYKIKDIQVGVGPSDIFWNQFGIVC